MKAMHSILSLLAMMAVTSASLRAQSPSSTPTPKPPDTAAPFGVKINEANQMKEVGESLSFTLSVSGGTPPFTYQWFKNESPIANANSSRFSIANVQASDVGAYSALVSNSVGSAASDSKAVTVAPIPSMTPSTTPTATPSPSIDPSSTPKPSSTPIPPAVPRIIRPTANQINTPLRSTFQWGSITVGSDPITYDLVVSTSSDCSQPVFSQFNTAALTYNLEPGFSLQPDRNYYACVRARDTVTGLNSAYSTPSKFSTRGSLKAPVLYTIPATTENSRSGQVDIIVGGVGGEEKGTARVFQRTGDGEDVEVGAVKIDSNPQGRFEIPTNVLRLNAKSGRRDYVAYIERCLTEPCSPKIPGSTLEGPKSDPVAYYYEDSLALPAPVLAKTGDLGFDWKPIPAAKTYNIYRRIGMEMCLATDEGEIGNCYKTSGFRLIDTKRESEICGRNCAYKDFVNVSTEIKAKYGISYFVTAARDNTTSPRSRAVRFVSSDGINAKLPPTTPMGVTTTFVPSPSGKSTRIYYCGVDTAGFLNADNFPDLGVQIQHLPQAKAANQSCTNFQNDPNSQSRSYGFDTLSLFSDPSASDRPCVLAAEVTNLNPATNYCFRVCQFDEDGLTEEGCSPVTTTSLNDTEAPDFKGITSLIGLSSGTSLQAFWQRATEPGSNNEASGNVVQYEVRVTKSFDASGHAVYNDDIAAKIVKGNETNAVLENLETNTLYCAKVSALDGAGNRSAPPKAQLCTKTLDNRPQVSILSIRSLNPDQAYNLVVEFQILDRLADLPNHKVIFDKLEYKIEDKDWMTVDSKFLSNFDLNYLLASTSASMPAINRLVWNTLPYFSGEKKVMMRIRVKNNAGNGLFGNTLSSSAGNFSDVDSTDQQTVFQGMTNISSYGRGSLNGCSLQANDSRPSTLLWLWMCAGFVTLFGLRRASSKRSRR